VPASRIEGARWLQRAAAHGHIEAQTLLGGLCVHGLAGDLNGDRPERLFAEEGPGEPDFATALKWARPAAEAGSAKAQAVLAYVLTCGPEEMRDLEAAHRWYQRSAASGCPEGCLGYALPLAPRTQDEAERHEVAEHLRRAAEAELPTAIYLPAVLTEQGVGVARDPVVAAQLYGHAAERGQRSAQLRWGLALMALPRSSALPAPSSTRLARSTCETGSPASPETRSQRAASSGSAATPAPVR
jgi:uncharacterized protein